MTLSNINKSEKGFTIVELLIVIVIIGILAAITIVAYNGITNRANASSAKQNAQSVQTFATTYQTDSDNGQFPAASALTAGAKTPNGAATLPSGVSVTATVPGTANTSAITYVLKGTTGACIGYFPYGSTGTTTLGLLWIYAGDATTVGGTTSAPTCS